MQSTCRFSLQVTCNNSPPSLVCFLVFQALGSNSLVPSRTYSLLQNRNTPSLIASTSANKHNGCYVNFGNVLESLQGLNHCCLVWSAPLFSKKSGSLRLLTTLCEAEQENSSMLPFSPEKPCKLVLSTFTKWSRWGHVFS